MKLKIYLGDLTHDSVGLATEVFPLNIGFVGAYCKKRFGDRVDVTLFKYIAELEDAIDNDPPDILALSNYPWCHNADLAMLKLLKKRKPEALRVMGGPNFPHEANLQREFLAARPLIDTYPYLDGEIAFANFVDFVFNVGGLTAARELLKSVPIPGCVQLNGDHELVANPTPLRVKELDEVPSPYLTGLLDKFFDGRLTPMIQTNRGCPFTCTFCADGAAVVSKINHFSVERVKAEIAYIGRHVAKDTKALFVSDLNFGMYVRDAEICAEIARIKDTHDYPHHLETTTGKNSKERVIRNVEKLAGALRLTMSVQSMTPDVLKSIKRDNLRLDDFLGLKPTIQKVGLTTSAELILGLAGETKESHIESMDHLLSLEMDHVLSHTLMLLNGAEINLPAQRARWGYMTKFRVIPRDFTRLKSGENVVEVEEVVVESSAMPFEDYVEARKFVILVAAVNNKGFKPLLRFLLQNGFRIKTLLLRMLDALDRAPADGLESRVPQRLVHYIREMERETREELWDSEEELVAFFQDQNNFQGLIEGRYGANVIQTFTAKIWGHCFDALADCAFLHAEEMIAEANLGPGVLAQLAEVERFCRCVTANIMGEDRMTTVPETELSYDLTAWTGDPESKPIGYYAWGAPRRVRFTLTQKQYDHLEGAYKAFGRSDLGRGKVLIRLSPNALWRTAVLDAEAGRSAIS